MEEVKEEKEEDPPPFSVAVPTLFSFLLIHQYTRNIFCAKGFVSDTSRTFLFDTRVHIVQTQVLRKTQVPPSGQKTVARSDFEQKNLHPSISGEASGASQSYTEAKKLASLNFW